MSAAGILAKGGTCNLSAEASSCSCLVRLTHAVLTVKFQSLQIFMLTEEKNP